MLLNLVVNVCCRSDRDFCSPCRIPGQSETEASVFLSVCSCSGITDLKLQLSVSFKDEFVWMLTLPRESGLLLQVFLCLGISWSLGNIQHKCIRGQNKWSLGFFSSSCNISSEQTPLCVCHSPMGHSPLPFLIVTDLVTVRLENPFYTPSCTSQPLGSPTPNFKTVMRRGSPQWEPNSSLRKIISKHFSCCSEFHLAGECHQTLFFFG